MNVREAYTPKVISATGAIFNGPGSLAGVLCTTGGTILIRETDGAGATVVNTLTCLAGQWYAIPFAFGNGAHVTIGGGFVGTFAVGQD